MSSKGLTLVELLLSMAILGMLMLAFTQVFGGSLRASSEANARNELYIYNGTNGAPNPMTLSAQTNMSRNTVRSGAGQNWIPNTDPFIAILLPPTAQGTCPSAAVVGSPNENACFKFYAYYAMRRADLISFNAQSAPNPDPNNADGWVLIEYSATIWDGVNRSGVGPTTNRLASPPTPGTAFGAAYTGQVGRMLIDFVQPTNAAGAPAYTMFRICTPSVSTAQPNCPPGTTATSPQSVGFNLRLLQNRAGKALAAPVGSTVLSTRVYPRN